MPLYSGGMEFSMKKICIIMASLALVTSMSACGGKTKAPGVSELEKISPDQLVTVEAVSTITGVDMIVDEEGVTTDGDATSVTYVPKEAYSDYPVTISIEQFSESLTPEQVWYHYENSRIYRGVEGEEILQGIGEEYHIAYPFINVYDRGCFIRISAGEGSGSEQKELLENLASIAAGEVERVIPEETYNVAKSNVIK